MTFTDDDLKRLKELLAKTVQPTVEEGQEYNRLMDKMGAIIARLEAAEALQDFAAHEHDCIRNSWEAGEPTPDGGYRTRFRGKWYQSKPIDQTPRCDCGLEEADNTWRKAAGK